MNFGFALQTFIIVFVFVHALTLLHELGHALVYLLLTDARVTVKLGAGTQPRRTFTLGRLQIVVYRWLWLWTGFYHAADDQPIAKQVNILSCIAGPFVSLLMTLLCVLIGFNGSSALQRIAYACAAPAFFQFLVTAIPMTYPRFWGAYSGGKSDGARLLDLLRSPSIESGVR